jgi:opacity protein-like surface antigen
MMKFLAVAAVATLALSSPVLAQTPPSVPAPPKIVATPKVVAGTVGLSVNHAAALGAGLFIGAVAGSTFIGGTVGAVIGGAAGTMLSNWWYANNPDPFDD